MSTIAALDPSISLLNGTNGDSLYEIVNGKKVELPSMGVYASWIAKRLAFFLDAIVDAGRLGAVVIETLFILDNVRNIRRRPDVAFVSASKWSVGQPLPEIGDWNVVPDLAVEVISPNDVFQEVLKKMEEYFSLGVAQVWVVVPSQRQIYRYESPTDLRIFTADEELEGGTMLPGLRLPIRSIFEQTPVIAP
ncbi:MAG TPA: Uma2 family endonuclease [Gemmataceae bacterium]|nr:Uma2 family endonuclease [Gemmataceae bacterium]